MKNLKILKLGGSAITDKTKPNTPMEDVINRVAEEVAKASSKPLILIHGGGSFGHPVAKEYGLVSGFKENWQLTGFVKTRQAMMALNKLILDAFILHGLNVMSLQPSTFIKTRNGRIASINTSIVTKIMKMGLIPMLYGDVVFDQTRGFAILSGDQLAAKMAVLLKAEKIILATDVDGVFTSDPKTHPDAKLIPRAKLNQLKQVFQGEFKAEKTFDVTGSMKGKLKEISLALRKGVAVVVVNALKEERVFQALMNGEVVGTLLEP